MANVAEIPQAIIFHDTISDLEVTCESLELRLVKAGLPKMNGSQRVVEIFHYCISTAWKEKLLRSYSEGNIRILCATEVFGLGIDIATIQRTIIYRVVNRSEQKLSLEMIMQRLGRVGRDPRVQAVGVLFYESWCFGEIASTAPGIQVKAGKLSRKITSVRGNAALSNGDSGSETGSGEERHVPTARDSNPTKITSRGATDAEKRKHMVPETYAFINTTSC